MEIRDKARNAFRKTIPNEKTVTNLEIGIFNYS